MSRSGYDDDCSGWPLIRWRGAVASGIRGARGQKALREMLEALDAMETKKLIRGELVCESGVCALGALAQKRGLDVASIDPEDSEHVAKAFGLSEAMVREIVDINDDCWFFETPEQRFNRVRNWVIKQIQDQPAANPQSEKGAVQ